MGNDTRTLRALLAAAVVWGATFGGAVDVAARGANIVPVYEGWYQNPDGTFDLFFGYFNRNWDEEVEVRIGPGNVVEPGEPDQGQPTHFYPRRSRFMFHVRVPKSFGKNELVWTLTANGKPERAYATLRPEYVLDKGIFQYNYGLQLGSYPDNIGPELKVDGGPLQQARVGVPLTLTAIATDPDGKPKPSIGRPIGAGTVQVPTAAAGLRFSWHVYRGTGSAVTFDPLQFNEWEDYREGRNSPYSPGWLTPPVPSGSTWVVQATFTEPGTYVLRALAHDGGLASIRDVTVNVSR